jgi:hypothetical protein
MWGEKAGDDDGETAEVLFAVALRKMGQQATSLIYGSRAEKPVSYFAYDKIGGERPTSRAFPLSCQALLLNVYGHRC